MLIRRQKISYPNYDGEKECFEIKIFFLGIPIYSNIELNDISGNRPAITTDDYIIYGKENNIDLPQYDKTLNPQFDKAFELSKPLKLSKPFKLMKMGFNKPNIMFI
jgi:hypothetical protein